MFIINTAGGLENAAINKHNIKITDFTEQGSELAEFCDEQLNLKPRADNRFTSK